MRRRPENMWNKVQRFSIRKFSFGVTSALVGTFFLANASMVQASSIEKEAGIQKNQLEINNGRLTGRLIGQVITREVKEEIFLQWVSELDISLDRTIAIGDGANDLKMLKKAGIGVAFCAKDVLKREIKLHIDERDLVKVLDLIDFL